MFIPLIVYEKNENSINRWNYFVGGCYIFSFYNKSAIKNVVKTELRKRNTARVTHQVKPKNLSRREVWGIDISHHQKSINWEVVVRENRPDFIFMKVSEGATHVDTKYAQHRASARRHNIPVGGYHFFSYKTSGKAQAENFIRNAKLGKGDLHPVLDIEYPGSKSRTSFWIQQEVRAFSEAIKKEYAVYPIIYCEAAFYNEHLKKRFFHFQLLDFGPVPRAENELCILAIYRTRNS